MRTLLAAVLVLRGLSAFAFAVHPEIPITPTELVPSRFTSDSGLATNGEIYVAVWTDHRSRPGAAYASRFRVDGTLLDRVGIRIADESSAGAVVWSGNAFLIAYLHGDVDGGTIEVRTLTPDGILGAPVSLFTTATPATQFRMRMATNGNSVLLVTSDANGALLAPDGAELREIDFGWPFGGRFGVAAAGSTYLVAAPRFNGDLKTQIVTAAGDLGESEILMDTVRGGIDVTSDGNRFLVAWARGNLYAQFVGVNGQAIDSPIQLTDVPNVHAGSHTLTRAIRRGDEFVLMYYPYVSPTADTLRLGNDGTSRGPLFASAPLRDIAVQNGHGAVLTSQDQVLSVAFFDAGAPVTLRNPTPVSLTGKQQSDVQLARVDGGFAVFFRAEWGTPELFLSRGPGSTPVLVVAEYAIPVDVVVEGGAIWVFWVISESGELYTRRYTQALQPIDAEPVFVAETGYDIDHAVAAGGGAVVVVRNRVPGPYSSDIDAHILHRTPAGVTVTNVGITTASGHDHAPAIEWNGNAFVIAWANALGYYGARRELGTNDVYTGFFPDDRILFVHMSAAGEVLEPGPLELTRTKHLDALHVVNGIAVWQTYESPDRTSRRHTYAARVFQGATIADLGGEDTFFGAVAPDDGGFILTRATPLDQTTIAPEILTVDANISVTATVPLPPIAVNFFYDEINPYDADVLGGSMRILGYSRIAAGAYGHEQRVFVRRMTETARRRALRINH